MPQREAVPSNKGKKTVNPTTPTKLKSVVSVEDGKASVSYSVSITKSTGPFEGIKIQAGIVIPYGAPDALLKELDKLLVVARTKVTERIAFDIDEVISKTS